MTNGSDDQAEQLAEDELCRACSGIPGHLEMDARSISKRNLALAAELGLQEVLAEVDAARASGSPARYYAERAPERGGDRALVEPPAHVSARAAPGRRSRRLLCAAVQDQAWTGPEVARPRSRERGAAADWVPQPAVDAHRPLRR